MPFMSLAIIEFYALVISSSSTMLHVEVECIQRVIVIQVTRIEPEKNQ